MNLQYKIYKTRTNTSEVLLNNVVDKDLQYFLRPLDYLQQCYFYPKYKIKDNFITSLDTTAKLKSFIATLVFIGMALTHMTDFLFNDQVKILSFKYFAMMALNYGGNSIGFLINFFTSISTSDLNVYLVLKLQKLLINLDISKSFIRNCALYNWFYIFLIFFGYLTLFLFIAWTSHTNMMIFRFIFGCFVLSFEFNVLYSIRIIALIKNLMNKWMKDLKGVENSRGYSAEFWNDMFECYGDILEAYNICIKVCQDVIIYLIADTFFHGLFHVYIWIELSKLYAKKPSISSELTMIEVTIAAWMFRHLAILVCLGVCSEMIYQAVADTDAHCAVMMKQKRCSEKELRMYKNVRRLNSSCVSKIKARGIFTIDASMPLRLMAVFTTYAVVFLQFAFI